MSLGGNARLSDDQEDNKAILQEAAKFANKFHPVNSEKRVKYGIKAAVSPIFPI